MLSNISQRPTLLSGFVVALLLAAPVAHAQSDEAESSISQQGVVELTYDHAETGLDVVAATIEYGVAFRFAEGWTVQMDAVFEPVLDPTGDDAFEGEDAYIETLSVAYAGENFTIQGGKINPVFGLAADQAPGLYGVEVGEAYQLAEQVGIGGDVSLTSLLGLDGEHVLSMAVFRADRSQLSGSLGGLRDRVRLEDGGLGNTNSLKSYALSFDGALANGLGYSIGHRRLGTDTPGETRENTTVLGLTYLWPEDSGLALSLMGEVGASRNADGIDGASRDFYTAGAQWGLGDWFVNAIASGWNENATAGDLDLRKFELSVGREIAAGVVLEFGAQDARVAGASETIVGARLAFEFGC
jgi:hypothetical protein